MPDTHNQIESMIAYLLGLIWEQGDTLRKTGSGTKAAVFHAQTIVELAKGVKELGYALEFFNMAEPDEQPDAPQAEPAEWDQEQPTEDVPSEKADQ